METVREVVRVQVPTVMAVGGGQKRTEDSLVSMMLGKWKVFPKIFSSVQMKLAAAQLEFLCQNLRSHCFKIFISVKM